jgi:hypothetical protein
MRYECYNKIGERIGVAYSKREAEELIRRANWEIDLKRGTPEYERRVRKAQSIQQKELDEVEFGVVAVVIIVIIGVIIAMASA